MKPYRIYINDNTLIIADKLHGKKETIQQLEEKDFNFKAFYDKLGKLSASEFTIVSENPKAFQPSIFKVFGSKERY